MKRLTVAVVAAALVAAPAAPAHAERQASPAAEKKRKKSCKRKLSRRARSNAKRYCARRRRRGQVRRDSVKPLPPARGPLGTTPTAPQAPSLGAPLARYVSVAAREWSLTLSRPVIAAGSGTIELRNLGEDPHDLVLSRDGSPTPLASFPETAPGGLAKLRVNLGAGRYRLWCSLPGHEGAGMKATLRVGG